MWNSKVIYEELAKQRPHHSSSSWQNRFTERWRRNEVDMRNWNLKRIEPPQNDSPQSSTISVRFYEDLDIWAETETETGRAPTIPRWHQIKDVEFELWDLYAAVTTQDCGMSDIDWDLVAEVMGLDWIAAPEIPEVLEGCWDKYLSKFHEEISDFVFDTQAAAGIVADDEDLEEDDGGYSSEEELGQSGGEEMEEINASVGGGRKPRTSSSPTLIDLLPPPLSVLKRKRTSRQAEIPSTPDALLDTRFARLNDETPTRKRRKLANIEGQDKPPNQSLALALGEREVGSEAEDTAQEALQVLVRTPNALGIAEPETIMRTTIRTKTTTTAITTESLPGSSPHAARPSSSRQLRSTAVGQHRELPPPDQGNDALEELGQDEDEEEEEEQEEAEVVVAGDSADDLETEEEENNSEEVFAAIDRFEALGYDRDVVVESLFWTSMDPDKALTVMKSFNSGYDIPQNKQGIWTPQDDKKLKAVDVGGRGTARYRNALIKKHGQALVDARRRFLADAEAIGLSFH
ncbi:unnamed protein product [Parascedosporium putredinis]|uniref:DNA-binding protein RAP1 n=1 Tax=Parascedosporium putredinis TaxID=1442378 RepID=A0A9P1MDH9_9PEZI|nr:unnamed protein product [Parascedosporium putredinis]CAI8003736.1 unnamed protein product [Parascedosporium putredinis]